MFTDQERIEFHSRKQRELLEELQAAYHLPQEAWRMPPELRERFMEHYRVSHEDPDYATRWEKTLAAAKEHSGPVPADIEERVRTIADDFAPRIADAFYLHKQLDHMNPQNVSAFYRSVPVRDALGFSYKNHLCNVLDAELLEAGLDLKSAYLTMSRIVGHVISNCDALNKECPPNTRTLFETTVVPLRNRGSYSDFTVNMERKALQRYWYQESKKLEHWAKQNNIPEFYHAPTEAPKGYGL